MFSVLRDAILEALKAALTSWPSVELVRMERRWRGLAADWWIGIVMIMEEFLVAVVVDEILKAAVDEDESWEYRMSCCDVRGEAKVFIFGCGDESVNAAGQQRIRDKLGRTPGIEAKYRTRVQR
jgi:hypothetical protein